MNICVQGLLVHIQKQVSRHRPEIERESCSVMSDTLLPRGLYSPWNSPGQSTGVGSCSLLQEFFPTQTSHIAGGFFTTLPLSRISMSQDVMKLLFTIDPVCCCSCYSPVGGAITMRGPCISPSTARDCPCIEPKTQGSQK